MTYFLPQIYSQLVTFWWVIEEKINNFPSCLAYVEAEEAKMNDSPTESVAVATWKDVCPSQIKQNEWTKCLSLVCQ